jgi:hypothetical protein
MESKGLASSGPRFVLNRIGCGRLFQIARILGVHMMDFFDGSDAGKPKPTEARKMRDLIFEPQAFHLVEAFSKISDRRLRRSVVELVKQIRAVGGIGVPTSSR